MTVACIVFLPVHDNYLWNKLSPEAKGDSAPICHGMETRVKLLKEILRNEKTDIECHVLPFERDQGANFLKKSAYWERKLGKDHLPTISSADLLLLFNKMWVAKHFGSTARLSIVFGIDNLPWMPTWSNLDTLFSSCDLVLVRRLQASAKAKDADNTVSFMADPTALLRSFRTVRVQSANPVSYNGKILFGTQIGESRPECCSPDATSTLFLVSPLHGLPGVSSTAVRRAIAVLALHGYDQPALVNTLVSNHDKGKETLERILETYQTGHIAATAPSGGTTSTGKST